MIKEIPIELAMGGMSPRLAFFLNTLASSPDFYLRADCKRVGLTIAGQDYYTGVLFQKMRDILELIKKDPSIKTEAAKYEKEMQGTARNGTCLLTLSDEERKVFFSFLEQNNCFLNPLLQKTISTEITV